MHTPLAEVGQAKQPLPQARGRGLGICGARPVSTYNLRLFLADQNEYMTEARDNRPHAMAAATASDQKKTGDIASSRYQYLCFFDACSLVCLLSCLLVCLFVCFFVSLFLCFRFICLLVCSLRPTQWLQALRRTKQKQATLQMADIRICISLVACSLICLFACFLVCMFV